MGTRTNHRFGRIVDGIGENSLTQLRYNMITLWEFRSQTRGKFVQAYSHGRQEPSFLQPIQSTITWRKSPEDLVIVPPILTAHFFHLVNSLLVGEHRQQCLPRYGSESVRLISRIPLNLNWIHAHNWWTMVLFLAFEWYDCFSYNRRLGPCPPRCGPNSQMSGFLSASVSSIFAGHRSSMTHESMKHPCIIG